MPVLSEFSIDDAVALAEAAMDDAEPEEPDRDAVHCAQPVPEVVRLGRHNPIHQRARARVRWARRKDSDGNTPLTLHTLEHNHRYATRADDVLPLPSKSHDLIKGSGRWKQFTNRAVLRAAFSSPGCTAVEICKRFARSTGRHITDLMCLCAFFLRQEQSQKLAELFAPEEKYEWTIQDFSSDEASFRLSTWGEKSMSRTVYSTFGSVLVRSPGGLPRREEVYCMPRVMKDKTAGCQYACLLEQCGVASDHGKSIVCPKAAAPLRGAIFTADVAGNNHKFWRWISSQYTTPPPPRGADIGAIVDEPEDPLILTHTCLHHAVSLVQAPVCARILDVARRLSA